ASTSPRRKELLEMIGLKFKAVDSGYKEDLNYGLKPLALARYLSKGKAKEAAKKYKNHIIIAADTFVVSGESLIGKPNSVAEAKKMLKKISGRILYVVTGFTITDTESGKTLSKAVRTKVYIKNLTNTEINNYVKTKEPLGKAGAFAIQGIGALIVKKIEGDFFNVMGLPLNALAGALKKFGIHILG
ncbi:MAG: septum formation protein Maf, partial [Candidatus Omnitrophica bacterium]|nr:septum formation protein Maf [Candidatus Omnitrophota bacterium]